MCNKGAGAASASIWETSGVERDIPSDDVGLGICVCQMPLEIRAGIQAHKQSDVRVLDM
jgi:hypothetical protein